MLSLPPHIFHKLKPPDRALMKAFNMSLTKSVLTRRVNIYIWKLEWRTLQALSTSQVLRFDEWSLLCRLSILQVRFRLSSTCGARFLRFSALWNCSCWCQRWRQPSLWSKTLPCKRRIRILAVTKKPAATSQSRLQTFAASPSQSQNEPLLPQTAEDLLNETPKRNNSHQWSRTLTESSRQQPAASCKKR